MTSRSVFLSLIFCLLFYGCADGNLHLKMQLEQTFGLTAGDPVVFDNENIGTVTSVESRDSGGYVANIVISKENRKVATVGAEFHVAEDPSDAKRKRVEIIQGKSGGKPLEDGAIVHGTLQSIATEVFPFGELLKGFREGLQNLRERTERFRQEFGKVPDSEEARELEQEWRRLLEEIQKAQSEAQESLRKKLLPKLEEELENLRKKFEEMKPQDQRRAKPLGTLSHYLLQYK